METKIDPFSPPATSYLILGQTLTHSINSPHLDLRVHVHIGIQEVPRIHDELTLIQEVLEGLQIVTLRLRIPNQQLLHRLALVGLVLLSTMGTRRLLQLNLLGRWGGLLLDLVHLGVARRHGGRHLLWG